MDIAARIRHAELYPYERPRSSFLFDGRAVRRLASLDPSGRTPVIAAGSNASPSRLAAKFGADGGPIPVTRAELHDHAVVFAAHFSSYGALPATLHPCAGAVSEVFVTWLTAVQLERMHATEGVGIRYQHVELGGLRLEVDGHGRVERAGAYLGRHGALALEGSPVRLAAVPARDCPFEARDQPTMLAAVHAHLANGVGYQVFMARIIEQEAHRTEASVALCASAHAWPGREREGSSRAGALAHR